MDLSLGFLFCSTGLYFCLCASTILSWWLWLCSRVWSLVGWFLQFHSSFSRSLWLFEVFCISIQIVKLFVLALWWRRQWQATPVLLPRKSHGWRSLVGCSPWDRYESDVTERLHFDISLSHNGEGNGNPFQCSCLENPRDSRAWWAADYGVAQSWTCLKQLRRRRRSSVKNTVDSLIGIALNL